MASALDTRRQAFRDLLDRDLYENDISMAGGEGGLQGKYGNDSYEAQKAEIMRSPEYAQTQTPEYAKAKYQREQAAAREALMARQKAEEEGLFGQYQGTLGGQEKLSAAYNRLGNERGLSTLKSQFNTTKDLLDRLNEDVTARTAGSLTSEAARRRTIASESEPLAANIGRLGTAIGSATEDVGTQLQFLSADQQRELDPIKMRIAATSDRFAREISGFDNDQQTGLNFLLDKLNRDRQLTDMEWQKAADLAKSQQDFTNTKESLQIQFENDMKLAKLKDSLSGGSGGNGGLSLPGGAASADTAAPQVSNVLDQAESMQEQTPPLGLGANGLLGFGGNLQGGSWDTSAPSKIGGSNITNPFSYLSKWLDR